MWCSVTLKVFQTKPFGHLTWTKSVGRKEFSTFWIYSRSKGNNLDIWFFYEGKKMFKNQNNHKISIFKHIWRTSFWKDFRIKSWHRPFSVSDRDLHACSLFNFILRGYRWTDLIIKSQVLTISYKGFATFVFKTLIQKRMSHYTHEVHEEICRKKGEQIGTNN